MKLMIFLSADFIVILQIEEAMTTRDTNTI